MKWSLCRPWWHAEGGGGCFLAVLILNPVLDVTETQPYVLAGFPSTLLSLPKKKTTGTFCMGSCVGPITSRDAFGKRKLSSLHRQNRLVPLVLQSTDGHYTVFASKAFSSLRRISGTSFSKSVIWGVPGPSIFQLSLFKYVKCQNFLFCDYLGSLHGAVFTSNSREWQIWIYISFSILIVCVYHKAP